VARKPAPSTQVQKSASERGVNPCNTPDPGFGIYGKWEGGISMGQFIMPVHGGITQKGEFDVMIHFHGHEPVRKEWVQVMDGALLVGIDLGLGSSRPPMCSRAWWRASSARSPRKRARSRRTYGTSG
jgi:hypothetical protein